MSSDSFIEKLKEFNFKAICGCNCHKPSVAEASTQTSKMLASTINFGTSINGSTNGLLNGCLNESTVSDEANNNLIIYNNEKCHQNGYQNGIVKDKMKSVSDKCDFSTQTLSTGDIILTKVYFNEGV